MFSWFSHSSRPRTSYSRRHPRSMAGFWVTKLLKETLTGGNNFVLAKSQEASTVARYPTRRPASYANVVRGQTGGVCCGSLRGGGVEPVGLGIFTWLF